jgi:hypothetical protein
MCHQHLDLSPAEAHAAMAYYFDHQDEIDLEIEAEIAQVAQIETGKRQAEVLNRLAPRTRSSNNPRGRP